MRIHPGHSLLSNKQWRALETMNPFYFHQTNRCRYRRCWRFVVDCTLMKFKRCGDGLMDVFMEFMRVKMRSSHFRRHTALAIWRCKKKKQHKKSLNYSVAMFFYCALHSRTSVLNGLFGWMNYGTILFVHAQLMSVCNVWKWWFVCAAAEQYTPLTMRVEPNEKGARIHQISSVCAYSRIPHYRAYTIWNQRVLIKHH